MQIKYEKRARERVNIPLAPASKARRKARPGHLLRKLHLWLGLLFTVIFLLVVITGFLVQHRGLFHLDSRAISRSWLPAAYRPNDPDSSIRADIVITDLHSGRLFGSNGPLVIDSAAAAWVLMIASGWGIELVSRYRSKKKT